MSSHIHVGENISAGVIRIETHIRAFSIIETNSTLMAEETLQQLFRLESSMKIRAKKCNTKDICEQILRGGMTTKRN